MSYCKTLLAVSLLVLMVAFDAQAENNPVYTVEVNVDVTDVNAAKAREKAMMAANRKAFETVVRNLTTASGAGSLLKLSDDKILNFIKEVSVVSEKSSNVRYIADLSVTINEGILKAYMNEKEISSAVAAASKVVVLPVYRPGSAIAPQLWESDNPWKNAWDTKAPSNGLVSIVTAINAPISAQSALAYENLVLEEVLLNNNANEVYVLDAVAEGNGLRIWMSPFKSADSAGESVRVEGNPQSPEIFTQAVEMVSAKIENKMKAASIAESQVESSLEVIFNYNSLNAWVQTEKKLKNVPYVRNLQIEAMANGKVQFKLDYVGSYENLLQAVRAKSMSLNVYDSGFYLLEQLQN